MRTMRISAILALLMACGSARGLAAAALVEEDFASSAASTWPDIREGSGWRIEDGKLARTASSGDTLCRAEIPPVSNVLVTAKVRTIGGKRANFGIALRVAGDDCCVVRYYDKSATLQALSYGGGAARVLGGSEPSVAVEPDGWYVMKAAALGGQLLAKIWPATAAEPPWQLVIPIDRRDAGTIALVAHDDTQVQFDAVSAWAEHPDLTAIRAQLAAEEQARLDAVRNQLRLAAVGAATPVERSAGLVRRVHIVPHVGNDRYPVSGQLKVTVGSQTNEYEVDAADYQQQEYVVEVPEPETTATVNVSLQTSIGDLTASVAIERYRRQPVRQYVQACLDTLIEHGRDEYGPVSSPLFMAVLDADLLVSPEKPMTLDALVRLEDRIHRRGERGSNLWYDQCLLRALYRMSELTGDSRYSAAADDYIRYFFDYCYKFNDSSEIYLNGMPAWGTHVFWDCYRDRPAGDGDGNGPHEILVFNADWEDMYRVHPRGVRRTVEGIWLHHLVDKNTGLHNRHDDARKGCDFAFSGGSFVKALAFMHQATEEPEYLRHAHIVANWHWNNRNPSTGLTSDSPGLAAERYDGRHCFTTVPGPHAAALLEAHRLSKDEHFRDVAIQYIKAYDQYGWDEKQQTYWAMLRLDGAPVPEQPKGSGYDAFAPYGPVDVWRTTIYSYEFTLSAAQAAIQAYETTVRDGEPDAELLAIAKRWGQVVEHALPVQTSRRWKKELAAAMPKIQETGGGYAEDYGRAISLFVHLFRATNDQKYLDLANDLAQEAVNKLFHNGLFKGHPAKPYYETTNGVGLLMFALLELDAPDEPLGGAF